MQEQGVTVRVCFVRVVDVAADLHGTRCALRMVSNKNWSPMLVRVHERLDAPFLPSLVGTAEVR